MRHNGYKLHLSWNRNVPTGCGMFPCIVHEALSSTKIAFCPTEYQCITTISCIVSFLFLWIFPANCSMKNNESTKRTVTLTNMSGFKLKPKSSSWTIRFYSVVYFKELMAVNKKWIIIPSLHIFCFWIAERKADFAYHICAEIQVVVTGIFSQGKFHQFRNNCEKYNST